MPTKRRTKEKLAVILPSRGLVFSKTVEELLDELEGYDHQIFWSHGRPIPDCFEIPTRQALKDKSFTHLLTIEEDMIIPKGAIAKMLKEKRPVVAYDYPVTGDPGGTVLYETSDTAFFTGCGVMLVEMDIVRRMVLPIWRVDIAWNMKHRAGYIEFNIQDKRIADYGQQDIAFGLRLYVNQIPIYVIGKTGQRKLEKRGEDFTNDGCHEIVEYTKVSKQHYLVDGQDNGFRKVKLGDGRIIDLWHESAEKLVKDGKAELMTIGRAEFNGLDKVRDWVWLKST
jgi:hypothetical protein